MQKQRNTTSGLGPGFGEPKTNRCGCDAHQKPNNAPSGPLLIEEKKAFRDHGMNNPTPLGKLFFRRGPQESASRANARHSPVKGTTPSRACSPRYMMPRMNKRGRFPSRCCSSDAILSSISHLPRHARRGSSALVPPSKPPSVTPPPPPPKKKNRQTVHAVRYHSEIWLVTQRRPSHRGWRQARAVSPTWGKGGRDSETTRGRQHRDKPTSGGGNTP